ncbi:D-alanyl-D-alanine carboxypeptidase, partial [Clostridium perfringens]|nr:D-alanyl-D-alanine carboxypeptidase [Clostridium perfringens]
AIAIAEDIGGSVEKFSNIMNDFAKSLGAIDSHFESPHGLDSLKHYSSAYDLALLTSKGMENEIFREIVGEKVISKDKYNFTRDYQNINKILHRIPGANGVKTGYTGGAGKCLVSSVNYNGRNII